MLPSVSVAEAIAIYLEKREIDVRTKEIEGEEITRYVLISITLLTM